MSLPPVVLDDLTWADLTDATRSRIPAASQGLWTLHAPVDPGVTLLELHAWLLEQRLYWMDRLPDAAIRGALALLGDAPADAASAATVLHFPCGDGPVPAGTRMQVQDSDPPLVFTTEAATAVMPLAAPTVTTVRPRIDLRIGMHEYGPDLAAGKPVCLFDGTTEAIVTIWLAGAMPAGADGTLLFQLDSTGVPAGWSADATDGVAPAVTLTWWYAGPGGNPAPLPGVNDRTLGLRRSGIVRFTVPADWTAGVADAGNRPFTLWLRAESQGFAAPPRLVGLWPNVVVARHWRDLVACLELDWLPLPGNTIPLSPDQVPPLVAGTRLRLRERTGWQWWQPVPDLAFSGPDDRVFVIDRSLGLLRFGNGETGRVPVLGDRFTLRDVADVPGLLAKLQTFDALRARLPADLAARIAGAAAQTVRTRPVLRDLIAALNALAAHPLQAEPALQPPGQAARMLLAETPPGVVRPRLNRLLLQDAFPDVLRRSAAELHLRVGGGRAGNVGAWRAWEPAGDQKAPDAVNVVAGQGGAEPEALQATQQRSAGGIRRLARAVLACDFEALATGTPGVAIARAHAAVGFHPDFPCLPVPGVVTVFVVPAAPRDDGCGIVPAPVPDAGALAAVAAALDAARLLGTELVVRPPIYRKVRLGVAVRSNSAAPDRLRQAVTARLARFLDPLTGGDDGTGWPFGEKLRPSVLLRQAQDAIGAGGEAAGVAITLPDATPPVQAESCADVEIGARALPALEHVAVSIAPPPRAAGGLT
jgi:hypothetical protein